MQINISHRLHSFIYIEERKKRREGKCSLSYNKINIKYNGSGQEELNRAILFNFD